MSVSTTAPRGAGPWSRYSLGCFSYRPERGVLVDTMAPELLILDRLQGVEPTSAGWQACCPAHEDIHASLSVALGDDGKTLLNCHAGCEPEAIVTAAGLSMADLFHNGRRKRGGGGGTTPSKTTATLQHSPSQTSRNGQNPVQGAEQPLAPLQHPQPLPGCTLDQYSDLKGLPVSFLKSLGLTEIRYSGAPAVRIPYLAPDGEEAAVRFRTAASGKQRFKWRKDDKARPYGLPRLGDARKAGRIVLCEGESDPQTLWCQEYPALGIPGADTWKDEWADYLEGIPIIYVVIEADKGGLTVREWLSRSSIRDRARLVDLGEHKDPSGLYLDDPERFGERLEAALAAAIPWVDIEAQEAAQRSRDAWVLCREIAEAPDILGLFTLALAARGVVGEERAARLIYLALISRLTESRKPVSIAVKGPSGGGKSFTAENVVDFFPESAYYALSAMSERALVYSEEPLSHRFLIVYEAAGLQGEIASYMIRSLLSEGCIRYETVDKASDGLKGRLIERDGPTGLLVTTTSIDLHAENETRLLSITVDDTTEQTRDILLALADGGGVTGSFDRPGGVEQWRALQTWLESQERRVVIPYAKALAEKVPPIAVRLRRDFGAVLALIRAHAFLHQASRDRDVDGRIIATIDEDYATVRDIVADVIAEGVESSISATMRETVEAVVVLAKDGATVSVAQVTKTLQLDKSSTSRRVRSAIKRGFLKNLEEKKRQTYRLVVGDPLPSDVTILPAVSELNDYAEVATERERVPVGAAGDDQGRI